MKIFRIVFILALALLAIQLEAQRNYGLSREIQGYRSDSSPKSLQELIEKAQPGQVIMLEPGYYIGPAIITTNNIILDGQGRATVSGGETGTVITVEADNVTIRNLEIIESGGSHDKIDSGIKLKGNFNQVENCLIRECLFGVDIMQSNNNVVKNCEISSLSRRPMALKGDAIRLWYSRNNMITNNYWYQVRDMVVWYSSENSFIANKGEGNRYSIHFMYSHNNRIADNVFYHNSVGVFLMYSEQTVMTGNTIMNSTGLSGMCLGMKETSSNQILNNRFIYSSEGIHVDVSPFVPEKINTIANNEIAFCGVGVKFHTNQEGNLFKENYFHNNLVQVEAEGKTANMNKWDNNYYDDYQGFDKDKDNIGDNPYSLYAYVEHLWSFNRNVKFFYGSPLLLILDFLERLAPFSQPKFVLRDNKPMFRWENKEEIFKNLPL